jgi:hypothetical protein
LAVAHLAKQCPEIRGLPVEKGEAILPHLAPPIKSRPQFGPGFDAQLSWKPPKMEQNPTIVLDLS